MVSLNGSQSQSVIPAQRVHGEISGFHNDWRRKNIIH